MNPNIPGKIRVTHEKNFLAVPTDWLPGSISSGMDSLSLTFEFGPQIGFKDRLPVFHNASCFFRPWPHGVRSKFILSRLCSLAPPDGPPVQRQRFYVTVPPPPGGVALNTLSKFRSPLAADSLDGLSQCVCVCMCVCLCVTHGQLLFSSGWTHRLLIIFRSYSLATRRTQTFRLVEHILVLFPVRLDRFLLMALSNQDGHGLPASWRLDNDFIH